MVTEAKVRQWFIEVGCKAEKLNTLAIEMLATHLCGLRFQLDQEMKDGAFRRDVEHVIKRLKDASKAATVLQAWLRECRHDRLEKPVVPELAQLADALDKAMPWLLPPHPAYVNKEKRWHAHVHLIRDLVRQIMQEADNEVSFGSPTAPAMKVLCNALETIHGEDHAPDADAVRKYLGPDRKDRPYGDPWWLHWRRAKFLPR